MGFFSLEARALQNDAQRSCLIGINHDIKALVALPQAQVGPGKGVQARAHAEGGLKLQVRAIGGLCIVGSQGGGNGTLMRQGYARQGRAGAILCQRHAGS